MCYLKNMFNLLAIYKTREEHDTNFRDKWFRDQNTNFQVPFFVPEFSSLVKTILRNSLIVSMYIIKQNKWHKFLYVWYGIWHRCTNG